MNKLIVLTVVLIGIVMLFVLVSSQKTNVLLSLFSSPIPSVTPTNRPLQTNMIRLTIKNNKLIRGSQQLQVAKDQMVVLQITSDADDTLSLLGYDKHVFLQKGKMVVLSFLASLTGNFAYKLDAAKTVLGTLVVNSK